MEQESARWGGKERYSRQREQRMDALRLVAFTEGEGLRGPEANSWVRQGHTEDLDFRKWPQNRLVGIYMKTYTPVFPSYLLKSAHMKSSSLAFYLFQSESTGLSRIRWVSLLLSVLHWLWQKRKHALIERLLTQRLEWGLGLEFGLGFRLRLGLGLDV